MSEGPVEMEAEVNRLHLLAHPQKESQLDFKTKNTQNCQEIELYGSPTAKDLKKPHSCRRVGGAQRGGSGRTGGPIFTCGG